MVCKAKVDRKTSTNLDGFDADFDRTCCVHAKMIHIQYSIGRLKNICDTTFQRFFLGPPESPSVAKLGRARRNGNKGRASEKSRALFESHRAAMRRVQALKVMVNEKYEHLLSYPWMFVIRFVHLSFRNNIAH